MRKLILKEFKIWSDLKEQWLLSGGTTGTYLDQKVIPHAMLHNLPDYHRQKKYDMLLPPLQVMGNLDENTHKKVLLISLEPLKNSKDLSPQYRFFHDCPPAFDALSHPDYGNHDVMMENYLNYQLDYFNVFPGLIGAASPYTGTNMYWRYLDRFANGFLGNRSPGGKY